MKKRERERIAVQMEFVNELAEKEPQNTAIKKFMADPPTATMQRIKGLTAGTLPTFMDISDNFASPEIKEDNLIHQFRKHCGPNRTSIFVGDDTWNSLFPDTFNISIPFDSFIVKDLHTVDTGVTKNILNLLANGSVFWEDCKSMFSEHVPCKSRPNSMDCTEFLRHSWQLAIGHFLGVDHVGHTFSPLHSAMGEKLQEMDTTLKRVIAELKSKTELHDTLLVVFGDHGMTTSGNHGGASVEEREAGLLVYSPAGIYDPMNSHDDQEQVEQIDLVPSLSMWLGTPIPFGNIGSIVRGLRYMSSSRDEVRNPNLVATSINAAQVAQYMIEYANADSSMEISHVRKLLNEYQMAINLHNEATDSSDDSKDYQALESYRRFHQKALSEFQTMWTKFNLHEMIYGILVIAGSIILKAQYVGYSHKDFLFERLSVIPTIGISAFIGGLFISLLLDTKRFWVHTLWLIWSSIHSLANNVFTTDSTFSSGFLGQVLSNIQARIASIEHYLPENVGLAYPCAGIFATFSILRNTLDQHKYTDGQLAMNGFLKNLASTNNPLIAILNTLRKWVLAVLEIVVPSWVSWVGESLTTLSFFEEDASNYSWKISSILPPPIACGCLVSMIMVWLFIFYVSRRNDAPVNVRKHKEWKLPSWMKLVVFLLIELRLHGLFSNSFIVAEPQLITHILVACLLVTLFILWESFTWGSISIFLVALATRGSCDYVDWQTDSPMQPHPISGPTHYSLVQVLVYSIPGFFLVLLVAGFVRHRRNPSLWLCNKWILIITTVCHGLVVIHWCYQSFHDSSSVIANSLTHSVINYSCRCVYLSAFLMLCYIIRVHWFSNPQYGPSQNKLVHFQKILSFAGGKIAIGDLPGVTALLAVIPLFLTLELVSEQLYESLCPPRNCFIVTVM